MEVFILKENLCKNCKKKIPKKNIFCDNFCQGEFYYKEYISKWKNGIVSGTSGKQYKDISNHIRRYLFEKYDNKCSKCGWGEENVYTGKIPLEIHHIDGNCCNNREENLDLLCPNSHSLTENYGSRNKGNSKRYKKQQNKN